MKSSKKDKQKSHSKQRKKSKKKHHKKQRRDSSSPELIDKKEQTKNDNYDATGFKRSSKTPKMDICGYTDDNNPFMDPNLTKEFVWKKKNNPVQLNFQEKQTELENVQKRMKEHERLREERLLEQEIMQRAKEAQNFRGRKSDSNFDIEQAKNRSKIRIAEGRAKPIDLLIQYVTEEENSDSSDNADAIIHEPTQFLIGLSKGDLDDLIVDIHDYSRNMEPGKNTQYWDDIRLIAEDELGKMHRHEEADGRTEGVTAQCAEDMRQMIVQSSIEEATALQADAQHMLATGDRRHIDVAYYEFFCKLATVQLAKRRLQERHSQNLRAKLNRLKHEQGLPVEPLFPCVVENVDVQETTARSSEGRSEREPYDHDRYSPILLPVADIGEEALDHVIYRAEDDSKKLAFMRQKFMEFGTHAIDQEDALLLQLAQSGDEKGDIPFGQDQHQLHQHHQQQQQQRVEEQSFLWSDKYRPRKPRFLNRVNTGFDWNKYNQTHYDMDNPPPKIVQGYKFNILYPDLIDKTRTPTFELTPCSDDDQYAMITFKAGPPYEDIAFKIVNREWETSERHGYKCQFYRDMLQLYFHFKRYRYRK